MWLRLNVSNENLRQQHFLFVFFMLSLQNDQKKKNFSYNISQIFLESRPCQQTCSHVCVWHRQDEHQQSLLVRTGVFDKITNERARWQQMSLLWGWLRLCWSDGERSGRSSHQQVLSCRQCCSYKGKSAAAQTWKLVLLADAKQKTRRLCYVVNMSEGLFHAGCSVSFKMKQLLLQSSLGCRWDIFIPSPRDVCWLDVIKDTCINCRHAVMCASAFSPIHMKNTQRMDPNLWG